MPITIRGSRNRTEGWAVDVEPEAKTVSQRERLASNTPLWVISTIIVLFVCVGMIAVTGSKSPNDSKLLKSLVPGDTAKGNYLDEDHQNFISQIKGMEKKRGVDVQAEFMSDGEVKIVVASDVGYDEIAYMSRFTALGVKRIFGNGAAIYAYRKDSKVSGKLNLTATTRWSDRENNFLTKPERSETGEPASP